METAHLIPGSLIRPGDVYALVGDDGMAVAYDVAVVSPVVESSLSSSARSVDFAADAAELRKAVHYANNCASHVVNPTFNSLETGLLTVDAKIPF
jgi:hypothetical protein